MENLPRARPLRSMLFIPGNKEEWMRKAPKYGADALIFDLEDAVPEDQKVSARKMVRRVTEELGAQGQAIFVRVNDLTTGETGNDLEAVVCSQLTGILLPKVSGANDVVAVSALLDYFERRSGTRAGHTIIDPLLETAESLRNAYEISNASPRVEYVGAINAKDGDVARALGFEWTPDGQETVYIRQKALLDAKAAGLSYPVAGLWTPIADLEGLRKFAVQTRQIGYTGMLCIHPTHVPVINQVFSPTEVEISFWRKVIASMEEAERQGSAAVRVDGALIDTAHLKHAQERLEFARRLGLA